MRFILSGILFLPAVSFAQKDDKATTFPLDNFYSKIKPRPQSFLKNIKFGLSLGYGNTFYSHELKGGYGIYQAKGQSPSIFLGNDKPVPPVALPGAVRSFDWINKARSDGSVYDPTAFQVSSDTAKIGFKGNALNIPIKATIHYEIKGKYRIGAGYSYEYMSMGSFNTISYGSQIGSFTPTQPSGWMSKYFGLVGVSFYRLGDYLFTGDAQIGGFSPGSNFDSKVSTGVYVNVGVTIERELSEYFRIFARPSYEIKNYSYNPGMGGGAINQGMNAAYLNIGISYSIPELPKCFIRDCKIQINHVHGNKEYRSRVHPIYKKQNPQYGENYPNMIKYKGKNKKKMNPY